MLGGPAQFDRNRTNPRFGLEVVTNRESSAGSRRSADPARCLYHESRGQSSQKASATGASLHAIGSIRKLRSAEASRKVSVGSGVFLSSWRDRDGIAVDLTASVGAGRGIGAVSRQPARRSVGQIDVKGIGMRLDLEFQDGLAGVAVLRRDQVLDLDLLGLVQDGHAPGRPLEFRFIHIDQADDHPIIARQGTVLLILVVNE